MPNNSGGNDMDGDSSKQPKYAPANGISLCYDTFGNPASPPLLLIMGLGAQMVAWDDDFCRQLAGRNYFVVRFDNRDIGLSTRFPQLAAPGIAELVGQLLQGKAVAAPYTLRDMAADAVGLLDVLGLKRAHVVGASMGGAIGQELAINFPDRLLTLTSIMSSTGDPSLPQAKPEAIAILMTPPPKTKEEYLANFQRTWKVLRGPDFPEDEARDLERANLNFSRGLNPQGVARQFAAIIASGNRTEKLKAVHVPTLVIHGDADPLVPVEGGVATAAAIPGAKLVRIPRMGHALPIPMWRQVIDAIAAHAR
jgi:pimeloyl-ACP methyl ester carboxylesterase